MKKLCLALSLALCWWMGANASTIDPKLAKSDPCGKYELFHINGIMTDFTGAALNLDQIRTKNGNAYKEHLIVYRLAYNQTRGFAKDFTDSALQVMSAYLGATWDSWMQAVTYGVYDSWMSPLTSQAIAKAVTDLYGFTKPSPYQDADLHEIIDDITSQTSGGGHRLMVAHSQGVLYMNLVYDKMVTLGWPAGSFGLVGVAAPSNVIRTGNVYTTSSNDVVIDSVRIAMAGNVLGPNVNIPYAPMTDILGHNLRATYLANNTAKNKIIGQINSEFGQTKTILPSPIWPNDVQYVSIVTWPHCSPERVCSTWYQGVRVEFVAPVFYWWTPSYTTRELQFAAGGQAEALAQAKTNALACYSLHIAETKRLRATGYTGWVTAPQGCWDMLSNPQGSWSVYSGDKPGVVKTTWDVNGVARATIGTVCRG